MSSDPHPTTTSFLRSSIGSISTDLDLHPDHPYTNSPWIRRLHPSSTHPLPPPQSTPIRDHSHSTLRPISTYESHTPLQLPQAQNDQPESDEVISGFGPYHFKATSREISKKFPLVARIAHFSGNKRSAGSRRKSFKLSPFFQFMPSLPAASSGSSFTKKNFSVWRFPVKEEYLAEVEFREGVSEASPNKSVQMSGSPNFTNQEEGPFSYWNLGRFHRNKSIPSFASVPSLENLPRKRSKGWSHV